MNFDSILFNDRLLITRKLRAWAARRRERMARISTDADELIASLGEDAYFEAVQRSLPRDGGWPKGHWHEVGKEIHQRTAQRGGKTPR